MMYQNDILPVLTTKRIILSNINRSSIPSEPQSESQRAAQRAANDRRERERDSLSASERARMREEDERREREGRESGIKIEFLIFNLFLSFDNFFSSLPAIVQFKSLLLYERAIYSQTN